jgi:lipase
LQKLNMPEILSQDIGEADIQYLHYPGAGPAVILLHATGFNPWLWHPVARGLAGEFRVIVPYFCDHREADPEEGGLSWLILADDLTALITRLGISKPLIVGHSMGGTVASIAEALHGPIASRMVLIEPIFLPSSLYDLDITVDQHPLASKAIRRRNRWSDRAEASAYLGEKELFKNWDHEVLDLYLQHGITEAGNGGLTLACQPKREAALFMGSMAADPWRLMEKISCPVLLVEGELSENRTVIDLGLAVSMLPRAHLEVIAGAGHLVPMEKPAELLAMITAFFNHEKD